MVHTVLSLRSVREALDVPVPGTRYLIRTLSIDVPVDKQRIIQDGSYDLLWYYGVLIPVRGTRYLVPDGCAYIHVSTYRCVVESCRHELFFVLVIKYCETIWLVYSLPRLRFLIASYVCAHLYEATIASHSNQPKSMLSRRSVKY